MFHLRRKKSTMIMLTTKARETIMQNSISQGGMNWTAMTTMEVEGEIMTRQAARAEFAVHERCMPITDSSWYGWGRHSQSLYLQHMDEDISFLATS